jgi:hypothetical protein
MTTMNKQANNGQALRTNLFLAAIALSVITIFFGGYFAFGVVNGIPFTTMTSHAGDAFGVLFAVALLIAFVIGFPRFTQKWDKFFDQQAQISALIVERNNAVAGVLAAEQANAEAEERHQQEMTDTRTAHAMSISTMEDKHVTVIKKMLARHREEKRQQHVAWYKGYSLIVADRDRARQQVEVLQANQDRKLLAKADDLTALIVAAIEGNLTRASVQALVPIANGSYGKWSANLKAQITAVLATSVTAKADPSAPPSSPTPQDTVVGMISTSENPVDAPPAPEGESGEGTAPETTTDESADEVAEVTA